jgi:hypothetical protein
MVLNDETTEETHRCHSDVGVSLDRIDGEEVPYWVVYDIDPDADPRTTVFADEPPARLEYHHRVEALRARYGHRSRCCA